MGFIIPATMLFLTGITLIAIRLFQESHFYSASLLLTSLGAAGLFVALGMHVKKQNEGG